MKCSSFEAIGVMGTGAALHPTHNQRKTMDG